MENKKIGIDYKEYKCEKCDKKEIHYITIFYDGSLYECFGCGFITDTRGSGANE
jgi:hypothetical protein